MAMLDVGGRSIELNQDGYLAKFEDWDEDVARALAERDHLDLHECHWEAIRFLRDYYRSHEAAASPRLMIREVGDKLSAGKCTNQELKKMFPLGGCKHACRLAGLPIFYCHAC